MSKINDWTWQEFASIGSTNDEVKKLTTWTGQKFLVSSQEQTDGRGRRGRNWVSIPGNLFVSFALEVSLEKLGQKIGRAHV